MLSTNFKIIIFIFSMISNSRLFAAFSDMECIKADFSSTVTHKAFPFGLTEKILNIQKDKCELRISYTQFKYLNKKWIIDICRTPIHIKVDTGSIDVVKRSGRCLDGMENDFCNLLNKIELTVQDDGLIFADGRKENIQSDHGKIYCSYLLVDAYLRTGVVFDWTADYSNTLSRKSFREPLVKEIPVNEIKSGPSFKLDPADF